MIKHNLKLILRSLWTRRLYTLIILLSLTVGFVCSNILISFLVYEKSTDTFHAKHERIFQVFSNDPFGIGSLLAFTTNGFYDYLKTNYAEVEDLCQVADVQGAIVEKSNDKYNGFTILSVDSSFFKLFDFHLLQGRKDKSLAYDKIILSKDKALMLFGRTDVIDESITVITSDTTKELIIAAVLDQQIENSHLQFDALVHNSTFANPNRGGSLYALLKSDAGLLAEKLNKDPERPGLLGKGEMAYFFKPLTESYFTIENKLNYVKTRNPVLLTVGYIVCGLVLFIASFNFINLFLLSWQNRKREIGIKKTLGVTRQALLNLSIVEAGVYVLSAFLLSALVTFYILPTFNNIFETNLSPGYFLNGKIIASICTLLFFIACLVVIISVSKQWSMKPISLMTRDSSRIRFSRLLFTIQFVISITLAICAVTIVKQMNYIESAPLGFNRNIVQLNITDKKFSDRLPVLKQKVIQLSGVENVTISNGNPIFSSWMVRYELGDGKFYTPYVFNGDEDYFKTMDLTLVEGELPSESNKGKVVNETLVRQFNFKEPIGEKVPGTDNLIVGVVKDFTCGSFKQEIPPAVISYSTSGQSLLIDYRGNDLSKILPPIHTEWKHIFPDFPFNYQLIQEELMKKYKEETFFYKLVISFSVISIVLSCFGLFALSWAVIQNRTKEMGIRKVLGATAVDILNLLTWTFTKRILIAFVIAAPVGYYLMNQWLIRFANKIEIDVSIFCIAGLTVTCIAFLTLSFQTVKATMTNPVDEIRNE